MAGRTRSARTDWSELSTHGHVLVCIARSQVNGQPVRIRTIAQQVGVTERTVYGVLADLEAAGIVHRERDGRRNRYRIDRHAPLRHHLEAHRTVGDLLDTLTGDT